MKAQVSGGSGEDKEGTYVPLPKETLCSRWPQPRQWVTHRLESGQPLKERRVSEQSALTCPCRAPYLGNSGPCGTGTLTSCCSNTLTR